MFDCVIIGGGPASFSAAVYLARQKVSFAMFAETLGGKAAESSNVDNYLGLHEVTGADLVSRFIKHLDDYRRHFDLHEGETVSKVLKISGGFNVVTAQGVYQTKTLLIASGSHPRKLNIPGEKELTGKGVTYCATCDAPLFKDKRVAVIGGGNSAMDAALFAGLYAKHVALISVNPELRGEEALKTKTLSHTSITIFYETRAVSIDGKERVESLTVERRGKVERLEVSGVFIEIGLIPAADFIAFVGKDGAGQIVVDEMNRTDVEGVFAAGDVTNVTEKQISVAVGEGAKAALSIIKYLRNL